MPSRPALLPDRLLRFGARAAGAAVALVGLWLLLHPPWAAGFRAAGNAFFHLAGQGGRMALAPLHTGAGGQALADTRLEIAGGDGGGIAVPLDAWRFGYVPFAVVACLWFATRGGARRVRPRATVAAFAGAALYAALALLLVAARSASAAMAAPGRGPLATAVELGYRILVNPPAFEYAVPAFLWLVAVVGLGRERGAAGRAAQRS